MINSQKLQTQILSDTASCEALLKLLHEEREALSTKDFDRLDEIIEQKTRHLELLEQSAVQRSQWVQHFSKREGLEGQEPQAIWEAIVTDSAPDLDAAWQKLKTMQLKCQHENEINGKILAKNQKTFSRLLDIVRGQTAAPNLYSSSGKSTSSGYSHKVGEA